MKINRYKQRSGDIIESGLPIDMIKIISCFACGTPNNIDRRKFCKACGAPLFRIRRNETLEEDYIPYQKIRAGNKIHSGQTVYIVANHWTTKYGNLKREIIAHVVIDQDDGSIYRVTQISDRLWELGEKVRIVDNL